MSEKSNNHTAPPLTKPLSDRSADVPPMPKLSDLPKPSLRRPSPDASSKPNQTQVAPSAQAPAARSTTQESGLAQTAPPSAESLIVTNRKAVDNSTPPDVDSSAEKKPNPLSDTTSDETTLNEKNVDETHPNRPSSISDKEKEHKPDLLNSTMPPLKAQASQSRATQTASETLREKPSSASAAKQPDASLPDTQAKSASSEEEKTPDSVSAAPKMAKATVRDSSHTHSANKGADNIPKESSASELESKPKIEPDLPQRNEPSHEPEDFTENTPAKPLRDKLDYSSLPHVRESMKDDQPEAPKPIDLEPADSSYEEPAELNQDSQPTYEAPPAEQTASITQGVFDEVLRQHVAWLETDGREGRRANLSNLDLTSISFNNANLQHANMRGAILHDVDLSTAQVIDADMAEATLDRVNARNCDWSRVNITAASLHGVLLENAILVQVNALGANFYQANLRQTDMLQINLRDCILVEADFSDANMQDSMCRGSDVSRANFSRTNLAYCDMRDTVCYDTEFVDTILTDVSFKNAEFGNMSFANTDFSVAQDIPQEYQNIGFKLEKESIQQEKSELKQMQSEVQTRQHEVMEMKLQMEEQRNLIASLKADEHIYVENLQKTRKRLRAIQFIWMAVLGILGLITVAMVLAIPLESLKTLELIILFIVPIFILLSVLFTIGQVSSALKQVNHHSQIRERKVDALERSNKSGAPATTT